jgi:MATE family multidrug resistance protein
LLVSVFEGARDPDKFAAVAALVPALLVCVAAYSVVDAVNLTFSFALRGAGDTLFVTVATFCLAWPIMVLPTYFVVSAGGSVQWAWWFATAHIFAMAGCFYLRFRHGKWKTMRVIEAKIEEAA